MVSKQELIDFIDAFPNSLITKQDVLDFIESSKITRLNLQDCKLTINGREQLEFMYFRSGGRTKLDEKSLGQKVIVTFGPESIEIDDIASLVNYLVDKGYKLQYSAFKELVFVK